MKERVTGTSISEFCTVGSTFENSHVVGPIAIHEEAHKNAYTRNATELDWSPIGDFGFFYVTICRETIQILNDTYVTITPVYINYIVGAFYRPRVPLDQIPPEVRKEMALAPADPSGPDREIAKQAENEIIIFKREESITPTLDHWQENITPPLSSSDPDLIESEENQGFTDPTSTTSSKENEYITNPSAITPQEDNENITGPFQDQEEEDQNTTWSGLETNDNKPLNEDSNKDEPTPIKNTVFDPALKPAQINKP